LIFALFRSKNPCNIIYLINSTTISFAGNSNPNISGKAAGIALQKAPTYKGYKSGLVGWESICKDSQGSLQVAKADFW